MKDTYQATFEALRALGLDNKSIGWILSLPPQEREKETKVARANLARIRAAIPPKV